MAERIYLVRHGETDWAAAGRHTGTSDIPLNANGEKQAARLQPRLAGVSFTCVLSSPLSRARRTAELAGFVGTPVTPLLREVDYGDYDGKTRAQIRETAPGWDFFKDGPKNGETIEQAAARARTLLEDLRALDGNAILFAHGHILRILAPVYLGVEPHFGQHLLLRPATLSILGWEHDTPVIELWDDAPARDAS